jgi:hypothetical protein
MESDKHSKYYDSYIPNDVFFGIGIENESYMQFEKPYGILCDDITCRLKRDAYSVDYYSNYNMDLFKETLSSIYIPSGYTKSDKTPFWNLPLMINAYALQKLDLNGKHNCDDPMFKFMCVYDVYFADNYDKNYVFDGDTIEFMTLDFYNKNVADVCKELKMNKDTFLKKMNGFLSSNMPSLVSKYGNVIYPNHNHGIVTFLSNLGNISICNSATYHVNITLPTQLDENGNIKNMDEFSLDHSNAIRVIQCVLPFLVASYGTGDFLNKGNKNYVNGSLRMAFSRYISLGTYDAEKMEKGKYLNTFPSKNSSWFTHMQYDKQSYYNFLHSIGYDFNYQKFKNHGIEIRALDWFPDVLLPDVINFIILLCCFSKDGEFVMEFKRLFDVNNQTFQDIIYGCVCEGSNFQLNITQRKLIVMVFGIKGEFSEESKLINAYQMLLLLNDFLFEKYKDSYLATIMSPNMQKPRLVNYNSSMKMF